MKLKGIPLWEQYLEHIILAIAGVLFVSLTTLQFIGDPNGYKLSGQTISPGEVDDFVRKEALRVQALLSPEASSPMTIPDASSHQESFTHRLRADIAAEEHLVFTSPRPVLGDEGAQIMASGDRFHLPRVKTPEPIVVSQYHDALFPDDVDRINALQEKFPQQPFDVTWVTVASQFDLQNMREQFLHAPEGMANIPPRWHYQGHVFVLDLVLEREEYIDGEWIEWREVPVLPGLEKYSLRDTINRQISASQRNGILEELEEPEKQLWVIQPSFYQTVNGDDWMPPEFQTEILDEPDENKLLRTLRNRLAVQERRLASKEKSLEKAGGEAFDDGDGKPGGGGIKGGGGGGGGGDGGGFGGGVNPGGNSQSDDKKNWNRRVRLTKDRDRIRKQIEEKRARIAEIVGDAGENPEEEQSPLDQNLVKIWAHDMDIIPGHTYRYRLKVQVYNPFFAQKIHLQKDQKHFADDIFISSEVNGWSEPKTIEEPLKLYITRARAPGQRLAGMVPIGADSGVVHAEVYKFFDGKWWLETFRVEPGDRIGEIKSYGGRGDKEARSVDFSTEWFVLDIIEDADPDEGALSDELAAFVLLQNIRTGELSRLHCPRLDKDDVHRIRLKSRVEDTRAFASSG